MISSQYSLTRVLRKLILHKDEDILLWEVEMDARAGAALQLIGRQLDQRIFPSVKDGGIVTPSELTVPLSPSGVEQRHDEFRRQTRSTPGAWRGTPAWQGSFRGLRATGEAAPIIDPGLQAGYQAQLDAVSTAYPGARIWHRGNGFWIVTHSALLPALHQGVSLLTAVPFFHTTPRSWGFWRGIPRDFGWVGSRHTNFPDGSICAFEPADGTWVTGDSLVALLDLYTVWALRHLHLAHFGRWPGHQAVRDPYERLMEIHEDEHCGCDADEARYGQCCRPRDLSRNRIADAVSFFLRFGERKPPQWVSAVFRGVAEPPALATVFV
jgi:hypothetical protein